MKKTIKPRREPRLVNEDVLKQDSIVKNTDWIGCGLPPPPPPCPFALRGMKCDCLKCIAERK